MNRHHFRLAPGFTLLEVLVVIAIIALLSTLAMVSFNYARQQAKIGKAENDLDVLHGAMGQLMIDTFEWPGHQSPEDVNNGSGNEVWDLSADEAGLLTDDSGAFINWTGPYIPRVPVDPWGNPYFLDTDYSIGLDGLPCDGGIGCHDEPVIGSFGPNGVGQNVYDSDDIIRIVR